MFCSVPASGGTEEWGGGEIELCRASVLWAHWHKVQTSTQPSPLSPLWLCSNSAPTCPHALSLSPSSCGLPHFWQVDCEEFTSSRTASIFIKLSKISCQRFDSLQRPETCFVTPWTEVLLEKLTVGQRLKKLPAFGNLKCVTVWHLGFQCSDSKALEDQYKAEFNRRFSKANMSSSAPCPYLRPVNAIHVSPPTVSVNWSGVCPSL